MTLWRSERSAESQSARRIRGMPRMPLDTMPQARLVIELKLAIDAGDRSRIDQLIRENPRSVMASHVLRNIGKERAESIWYRIPEVFIGELTKKRWHDAERLRQAARAASARGTSD